MHHGLLKLKIKAKSLAEEARIIRREEHKLKSIPFSKRPKGLLEDIQCHRTGLVRSAARATHLARAYVKGQPYAQVEPSCREPRELEWFIREPSLKMIKKYGGVDVGKDAWQAWIDGAEPAHIGQPWRMAG